MHKPEHNGSEDDGHFHDYCVDNCLSTEPNQQT